MIVFIAIHSKARLLDNVNNYMSAERYCKTCSDNPLLSPTLPHHMVSLEVCWVLGIRLISIMCTKLSKLCIAAVWFPLLGFCYIGYNHSCRRECWSSQSECSQALIHPPSHVFPVFVNTSDPPDLIKSHLEQMIRARSIWFLSVDSNYLSVSIRLLQDLSAFHPSDAPVKTRSFNVPVFVEHVKWVFIALSSRFLYFGLMA